MLKRVIREILVSEFPSKIQNREHKGALKGINVRAQLQVFSIKNSLYQKRESDSQIALVMEWGN